MLVSEQVLTLSNKVGVLTNKAYSCAPALVSDLQGLSTDLRGLYEAVLEIEPSREDLRVIEDRLDAYPSKLKRFREGLPDWWRKAWKIDHPANNPCMDRVQGGVQEFLAEKLAEERDGLEREVEETINALRGEVAQMEKALAQLPSRLYRLVELRYFEGLPWIDVAVELEYSREWVRTLRDEALLILAKALES